MNGPNNFRYWRWVGLNLRQARERKAFTLQFCAQRIGVRAQDILDLECGNVHTYYRSQQILEKTLRDYETLLGTSLLSNGKIADQTAQRFQYNNAPISSEYIPIFLRSQES